MNPAKRILLGSLCAGLLMGCQATRPDNVGRGPGNLAPCPSSPNCVSTYADDSEHHMEPLTFDGSAEEAMRTLVQVVDSMERTKVIEHRDDYAHIEFKTSFWRFVDDVEFALDDSADVIHFRSASRLGYSDLGVNRERMKKVRSRFQKAYDSTVVEE